MRANFAGTALAAVCMMKLTQLPWLSSALCMTAGLYLLAGPFRGERSDAAPLLPLWAVLTVYEFVVIGMIGLLRRRGVDTFALTLVSLFFMADPVFLGDAFASTDGAPRLPISVTASLLALGKAWALVRACNVLVTPWRAGWVSAALVFIHQIPNLSAVTEAQPAFVCSQVATWILAGLAIPLWREGRLGRSLAGVLAVHFLATAAVADLRLDLEHLAGPLLALAALLPWPRYGWMPLPLALYTSPLRPQIRSIGSSLESVGTALVAAAFVLLGVGFWRSLRSAPPPAPNPAETEIA